MTMSESIRHYRMQKQLTQEGLASMLGVSAQAVSKWETTDTYPDPALLIPLAEALEISLDTLFGRETVYENNLAYRIQKSIGERSAEEQFPYVHAMCWQIVKGLYGHDFSDGDYDITPLPEDFVSASYICRDGGISDMANGKARYYFTAPEPADGWGDAIGDAKTAHRIFSALGDEDILRAVLYLHSKENGYLFEPEVLGTACAIAGDRLPSVMDAMCALHLVSRVPMELDGVMRMLYRSHPSHRVIALLLLGGQYFYDAGYSCQAHTRQKPFLG